MGSTATQRTRKTASTAVRITVYSSHGHSDSGIGVLLCKHPPIILTPSHVATVFEGDESPAVSIDGEPQRLQRIARFPGIQAALLCILRTKGPLPRGKSCVRLPAHPITLTEGQAVSLEKEACGFTSTVEGFVSRVLRDGDEEAIFLTIPIQESDSGAPVFVNNTLAGICQAHTVKGEETSGPAVVSPLSQDSLQEIRRLIREATAHRRTVRNGIALALIVAFSFLMWSHLRPGNQGESSTHTANTPMPCEPKPEVSAWLDKTYYDVSDVLPPVSWTLR